MLRQPNPRNSRLLVATIAVVLLSLQAAASNVLFVGDSSVSHLAGTGKPMVDALVDSGHEVRLWKANEIECNGFVGGSLSKIGASASCVSDLYEWADTVVLLAGAHDVLLRQASPKERADLAGRIREHVGDREFIWFDTYEFLTEDWSDLRVDWAHLSEAGYRELFDLLGLVEAD